MPGRLDQIIHVNSREINPAGVYRHYFWSYDKWVPINIDDRLPVRYRNRNTKDSYVPFAAERSLTGSWWVPLLEKAYAKFNGDYSRLEYGWFYEGFRQLTAKPVFYFDHKKVKEEGKDL